MAKSKKQSQVEESLSRVELEAKYGQVWNTRELAQQFTITSIIAPHVIVRRKADSVVGRMSFQNNPRYYHSFEPADPPSEPG
jgi:hypothetical protein